MSGFLTAPGPFDEDGDQEWNVAVWNDYAWDTPEFQEWLLGCKTGNRRVVGVVFSAIAKRFYVILENAYDYERT